jgi:hypothetical protein
MLTRAGLLSLLFFYEELAKKLEALPVSVI